MFIMDACTICFVTTVIHTWLVPWIECIWKPLVLKSGTWSSCALSCFSELDFCPWVLFWVYLHPLSLLFWWLSWVQFLQEIKCRVECPEQCHILHCTVYHAISSILAHPKVDSDGASRMHRSRCPWKPISCIELYLSLCIEFNITESGFSLCKKTSIQ